MFGWLRGKKREVQVNDSQQAECGGRRYACPKCQFTGASGSALGGHMGKHSAAVREAARERERKKKK